eukprot:3215695-Amphidinium_carterae.1
MLGLYKRSLNVSCKPTKLNNTFLSALQRGITCARILHSPNRLCAKRDSMTKSTAEDAYCVSSCSVATVVEAASRFLAARAAAAARRSKPATFALGGALAPCGLMVPEEGPELGPETVLLAALRSRSMCAW